MGYILKAIGLVIFFAVLQTRGELQGFLILLGIAVGAKILLGVIASKESKAQATGQSMHQTVLDDQWLPPSLPLEQCHQGTRSNTAPASVVQPKPRNALAGNEREKSQDFYEVIGVKSNASIRQIKNRCLELGQQCRPDLHEDDPEKEEQFARIEEAFATLSNPAARKNYDKLLAEEQKRLSALSRLDSLIEEHADDLLRKRRQLIVDKGYGLKDRSSWYAELDFFFSEVVKRKLGANAAVIEKEYRSRINRRLDAVLRSMGLPTEKPKSGVDFEHQCARVLEQTGWKVSTTKASGDQGADIVAQKSGKSVVLQCKLYSKPVGNGAVQEAFAAKSHYGTTHAAVVTNAGYTKAATKLAASTGVLLLGNEDLSNLWSKLLNAN